MAERNKIEIASLKARAIARSVSNVIRKRYPWLMFWSLLFWVPIAMLLPMQAITANALLLDSYLQLLVLASLNTMAMVFCIGLIRLMKNRIGVTRCLPILKTWIGDGSEPWSRKNAAVVAAAALVTPVCVAISSTREFSGIIKGAPDSQQTFSGWIHVPATIISIGIGIALACFFLLLAGWVKTYCFGSDQRTANFFPFEAVDRKGKFRFTENLYQWEYSVDVQLIIYTLILATLHITLVNLAPSTSLIVASAPAVAVVLLWVGGLVISGMAYWLDQLRIPAVLVLLVSAIIAQAIAPRPAVFNTPTGNKTTSLFAKEYMDLLDAETEALAEGSDRTTAVMNATRAMEERTWQAIAQRMKLVEAKDDSVGKTLVVVTCPGGGIHAAAWASCVLESISERYSNFSGSVCVISGVSGGSVGTLHFVTTEYSDVLGRDDSDTKPSAFKAASASSLEPISFGMMTDDLYGAFFPPLSITDRGQRLEQSIRDRLPDSQRELTLGHWGKYTLEGRLPIAIFNATDAVTGRRILFDSIPTPRRRSGVGSTSRPLNYRELLGASDSSEFIDVSPVTGARASATFPYVSPFIKPAIASPIGNSVAIGDGGYVDNEGIVSAVEWIEFILTRWAALSKADRPFQRILLLRVAPSASEDSLEIPEAENLKARLRWLSGPLETMVSVRSSSQIDRGNLESDLAALYLQTPGEPQVMGSGVDEKPLLGGVNPIGMTNEMIFNQARDRAASEKYQRRMGLTSPNPSEQDAKDSPRPNTNKPKDGDEDPSTGTDGAIFGPETSTVFDRPVVIKSIEFQTGQDGLTIPLNWKLSRAQKKWYPEAWDWNTRNDLELMGILDSLFIERK